MIHLAFVAWPGIATANEIATYSADVFFDTGSVDIPLYRQDRLNAALERSRQAWPLGFCVIIVGHVDRPEAAIANAQSLAMKRAQAVAQLIQVGGYQPVRFDVESRAERQPIYPPPDPRNARAEIEFLGCGR